MIIMVIKLLKEKINELNEKSVKLTLIKLNESGLFNNFKIKEFDQWIINFSENEDLKKAKKAWLIEKGHQDTSIFDSAILINQTVIDSLIVIVIIYGLIVFLFKQAKNLNQSLYPDSTFDTEKYSPYECGFAPFKTEWTQFDIKFYLIALLFLVFDVELMFILPYCLSYIYLGLTGYIIFIIFFSLLLVGFLVEWSAGMLIWKGSNKNSYEYKNHEYEVEEKKYNLFVWNYLEILDTQLALNNLSNELERYKYPWMNIMLFIWPNVFRNEKKLKILY